VDLSALIGGLAPLPPQDAPMPPLDFGSLEVASEPVVPALIEPGFVVPDPIVAPAVVAASVYDEPVFEMDFEDDEPAVVFENPTLIEMPAVVEMVTESPEELPVWTAPIVAPLDSIPEPVAPAWTASEPVAPAWTAPEPVIPAWTAPETDAPVWNAPEPVVVSEPEAPVFIAPEPIAPVFITPEPVTPVFIAPEPIAPVFIAPESEPIWTIPEPVVVPPVEDVPVFAAEPADLADPVVEPVMPSAPVWTAPEPLYVAPPILVPEPVFIAPEPMIPVVVPEVAAVVAPVVVAPIVPVVTSGYQTSGTGVLTDYFQLFVARREINTKPLEDIRNQLSASLNNREITNELFLARAVARAVHLLDLDKFSLARLEGMGLQAYQVNGLQHSFLEALQGLSRASHGASEGLLVVDASKLGVDDLVLPGEIGVLALGSHGKLTLSGNLPPLKSTEFLQRIAELLENPVGLVV
jgi:hypothetical protein